MSVKVLVADDSSFMRDIVKKVLKKQGFTDIHDAVNGQDVVTKFKEIKPNLVMLDILMPEQNGLKALKEMKSLDPNVQVIMVSSAGQEEFKKEAAKYGAIDFVTKPFTADDIIAALKKFKQ